MEKMTAQEIEQRAGEETVDCMIGICRGVHGTSLGKELCEACRQLQAYADLRTEKCPVYGDRSVLQCTAKVHCYSRKRCRKIREVMKYAGPRMLFVRAPSGMCISHFGIRKSRRDQYKGKERETCFTKTVKGIFR